MRSPDDFLFSTGGDGLQTYYQSIYHVKHDSTFLHQQGLNYPYGENIFFTGGQPLISNVVKLLKPAVDLSDHMVGITNWLMILGVLICPIFLYLIFKEIGLKPLVSIVFAVGITFLTQQWERFSGHYPLAWLYAVPGMIWMLMRFYANTSWKWTFIIILYMSFLVLGHIYYLVFFAVIASGFWVVYVLLNRERSGSFIGSTFQMMLQIVAPFLLLQWLMSNGESIADRTRIPWGFMVYRSELGGYLFPYGMWYEKFFSALKPKDGVEWEGLSYLGGAAILMLSTLIVMIPLRWKNSKFFFIGKENRIYFALATAAILCFAVSVAFPFNYGFEKLLYKLGPLQQFRGIGRFAFVAFYLIQILAIGLFFRLIVKQPKQMILTTLLFGTLIFSEAFTRIKNTSRGMHNERGALLRNAEPLAEGFQISEYQAILPFPFFHIGSENIGADAPSELKNYIYDLSLRTGLPTFAASMSRTSLSQSFRNVALSQEIMEMPAVLFEIPADKAILVVCDTNDMLPHQKELVKHCTPLFNRDGYHFYRLELDERIVMHNAYEWMLVKQNMTLNEILPEELYPQGDQTLSFSPDEVIYRNDTVFQQNFNFSWMRWREIELDSTWRGRKLNISFYVEDFKRDLIPRTTLEIVQKNGDETTGYDTEFIGKRFVGPKGDSGLISYQIHVDSTSRKLILSFENKLITGEEFTCRDLVICPEGTDCLILRGEKRFLNNRNYD